jgi:hypothetical protein
MKAMGQQNLSNEGLFAVLSTPPVLNSGRSVCLRHTGGRARFASVFRQRSPPRIALDARVAGTKYTVQMVPATGYMETWIRWDRPQ